MNSMQLRTDYLCDATGGRLLSGRHASAEGVSIDSRTTRPGDIFFAIRGDRFDGHKFAPAAIEKGAVAAVLDARGAAGLPTWVLESDVPLVLVPDTVVALGRYAAWQRARFQGPMVAITGSSGKTTTKEMTACVLSLAGSTLATQGNLNNHLGLPLTLLRLREEHALAVVEVGMNAPGELSYLAAIAGPSLAVVTSVGEAHVAGLGSVQGVARAKGELLESLRPDGLAVMPSDVHLPWALTWGLRAPLLLVGERSVDEVRLTGARETATGAVGTVHAHGERARLKLQMSGRYNLRNALLAIAVGLEHGVRLKEAARALSRLPALPMRGEVREGPNGTRWVLDAYNANAQSMEASLRTFLGRAPRGVLVLGDMLELGDTSLYVHRRIGRRVAELGPDALLIGVGAHAFYLVEAARAAGMPAARALHADDAEDAVSIVREHLFEGADVLLKGSRGVALERVFAALADDGEVG